MTETFEHILHTYGRPAEGSPVRFDHELQVGELLERRGQTMRVVAARSEERDDGRVRIVHLEPVTRE